MTNRLPSWAPLFLIAITLVIVFHRLLLGEVFFWGLPSLQFYPWRDLAFDMLRNGQLPLWNPYNGAGAPLLANYQSALLYPLSWSGYVLPLASTMSVTAALHLFIAAWGMWAFTGRLGLPILGRGVSALAFGMTGYLVARLGTYPTVSSAAWMPWVLWAALGILKDKQLRHVGWLGLVVGLQLLAGHAQTTWYSMLLVGLFTLFWLIQQRSRDGWQRLGLVIGGLLLGGIIAAAQLIPTAELLLSSARSGGVELDFAMNFSYGPVRSFNFVSPNFFGNPGNGTFLTEGAFFEDAVFIGLLPLIAAFAGVIGWILRQVRKDLDSPPFFVTVPFWLVIAIVAFVFALGDNTPIFPFLFKHVPTFDLFQAPVRWHIWTVFALSVLAGIGTQAWGRGHWLFFGTRLATAAGIGAALLAVFVAPAIIPTPENPDTEQAIQVLIQAVVVTGLLGAGAGVLTLLQPERDHRNFRWWSLAVLVFVAVDLGWAAQGLNPTITPEFFERQPDSASTEKRAYWPEDAERETVFETYLLFDDYQYAVDHWREFRASQAPNLNLIDRWHLLNNFEPLKVGHYAQYIDLVEAQRADADGLLQAAGVDVVYNNAGGAVELGQPAARAWFVEAACWHDTEASLIAALTDENWQPFRQVHLLGAGDCPALSESVEETGTVTLLEDFGNRVGLQVDTAVTGWLVLADTFYPGWNVLVDGQPTTIQRANLMFRAVPIPAGSLTVEFVYRPPWLVPGFILSLAGVVVMLVLFRRRDPDIANA